MDEHPGRPVHMEDLKRILGEWQRPATAANGDDGRDAIDILQAPPPALAVESSEK